MEIHATIGPNSCCGEGLSKLIDAGIDAVRLNMSYVQRGNLYNIIDTIRELNPRVKVGADIKGRKLRIGPLPDGPVSSGASADNKIRLLRGDEFTIIAAGEEGMTYRTHATVNYPSMATLLKPGARILLDDGNLSLIVKGIESERIECEVETGGELTGRCGINTPGFAIDLPPLSAKDYADLDLLSGTAIDFVYLSFVERTGDVLALKSALRQRGMKERVVAKVELALAVENVSAICAVSDAICIARGDLGVEIPLPSIPYVQRQIVAACKKAGVPVLLAGEVMFSLIYRHVPYRAELTDVTSALDQGIDGFILSDETAIGVDPANAIRHLRALIDEFDMRHKSGLKTL